MVGDYDFDLVMWNRMIWLCGLYSKMNISSPLYIVPFNTLEQLLVEFLRCGRLFRGFNDTEAERIEFG